MLQMPDLIATWPGAEIRPVLGNPAQGVKHLHVLNRCKDELAKPPIAEVQTENWVVTSDCSLSSVPVWRCLLPYPP